MGQKSAQGHITIPRQRNGKDGEDSIRRYIVVTPSCLIVDSGRTSFEGVNTLHCEVWMQQGKNNPKQTELDGTSVEVYKDSSATPVATKTQLSFDITADATAISYTFKLMYSGACVDSVTVPVYSKAQDSIRVDIDNEMDSVPCDSNGKIFTSSSQSGKNTSISFSLKVFEGTSVVPCSKVTYPSESNFKILSTSPIKETNDRTGVAKFTYNFGPTTVFSDTRYIVSVSCTYKGQTYTVTFTLSALRAGGDGKSPVIYQLLPSLTDISFSRASDNSLVPSSVLIGCGYTKTTGDVIEKFEGSSQSELMEIDGKYNILYRGIKSDGTFTGYNWLKDDTDSNFKVVVPNTTYYIGYEFILTSASSIAYITETNIVDRETIPINKDGLNGISVMAQYSVNGTSNWHSPFATGDKYMRTSADGGNTWSDAVIIKGENGANGSYTDYQFAISSQLTTSNPTTAPVISGSWSDTPVATTSSYPYLWCKATKVDSAGTAGTPSYFRVTGEKGENAKSVIAQYSVNGISNWHTPATSSDKYIRISTDGGSTYSSAFKMVGEDGTNGKHTDFKFNISSSKTSSSSTTAPSPVGYSSWQDAPIATTSTYPYLWCMITDYDEDDVAGTTSYVRLSGEKGDKGDKGDSGTDGTNGNKVVVCAYSGTRNYTLSVWTAASKGNSWNCENTSSYVVGDIAIIHGTISDKDGIGVALQATVTAIGSSSITTGVGVLIYGNTGAAGKDGNNGADGKNYNPVPTGLYDSTRSYTWDATKREYMDYEIDGVYYRFGVATYGTTISAGKAPTSSTENTNGWEPINRVRTLITETVFGSNAVIGGFMSSQSVMNSVVKAWDVSYKGEYSSTTTYLYDGKTRPMVLYNEQYWVVYDLNVSKKGLAPSETNGWRLANGYEAIAAADTNKASYMPKLIISGQNGTISVYQPDNTVWNFNEEGKQTLGKDGKKRIEIIPTEGVMSIFDSDGVETSHYGSEKYSSIDSIFGSSSGTYTCSLNLTKSFSYSANGSFSNNTYQISSGTLNITGATTISFAAKIVLTASRVLKKSSSGPVPITPAMPMDVVVSDDGTSWVLNYISLRVVLMKGSTVVKTIYSCDCSGSTQQFLVNVQSTFEGDGSSYYVAVVARCTLYNDRTSAASYTLSSVTCRIVSDKYLSRVFGNGIVYGTSANNFFAAVNESAGLHVRGVTNSGKYGFDLSTEGFKLILNGFKVKVPITILFMYVSFISSSTSLSIQKQVTFDGGSCTVSRSGEGYYNVTFPNNTNWSALSLSFSNCMCIANGLSTVGRDARVVSMTSTYCYVECSDDSSRNDGSFQLELRYLG